MKIRSFDIRAVKVPMREPHRTASGVIEICPLVLISAITDEGVRGDGIVFTYSELALKSMHTLAVRIAALLEGAPLSPQDNTDSLFERFKLLGGQGLTGMAIAGIDMALWDAHAKAQNLPLHALAAREMQPVRTYGPVKPYGNVGYDGVKGSAEGAARIAKQGFLGVKAKIGYPDVNEDIATIRAMRAAVGPDLALMVDYNQSLSFSEARNRLARLRDEGLTWVEEPVHSHDFESYVALQNEGGVPLQAGENWWGPPDFKIALNAGVRSKIMPDAQKCGGITGWLRIARMAADANVAVSSHLWPEASAQLLTATPTGDWLEYADWFDPILKEPLKIRNGYADIDGTIGTGVDFDDEAVRRFMA